MVAPMKAGGFMKSSIFLFLALFSLKSFAFDPICVSHTPHLTTRSSYTEVRGFTEFIELFDSVKLNGFTIPKGVYTPFDDVEAELNSAGNDIYCDEGAYVRARFNSQFFLELSLLCKNDSGPSMTLANLKLDCL